MFQRKPFDFGILIPTFLLSLIGTITISSVSPENLLSHIVYLIIGCLFFVIVFHTDRSIFYSLSNYLYLAGIVGLFLPFLFGTITRGSIRWIDFGFFTVQPSEIAKPILAIFSAVFLTRSLEFNWRRLLSYLGLVAVVVMFILIQPDLGSALVVLAGIAVAIIFSKIKTKHLFLLIGIVLMFIPIGWLSLHDYQRERVNNFMNPYRDPLGTGYNAIQAQIAVGSGGLFGKGIGHGTQSHLAFLPERYTDFIFASYAEEVGFIGTTLLILIYLFLFFRIKRIYKNIHNQADKILLSTLTAMLFLQTIVNIGMNIGIMPIAGVTLPLVSYGGSSIISTMISLAIISNISVNSQDNDYLVVR